MGVARASSMNPRQVGESTADGKYFIKREEECLAACVGAPMMMVDHVYYENLTPEKVDEILDGSDSGGTPYMQLIIDQFARLREDS